MQHPQQQQMQQMNQYQEPMQGYSNQVGLHVLHYLHGGYYDFKHLHMSLDAFNTTRKLAAPLPVTYMTPFPFNSIIVLIIIFYFIYD